MALEVYYQQDLQNALAAAEQATRGAGASGEYLRGYLSALNTLALMFGITAGFVNLDKTWRIIDAEAVAGRRARYLMSAAKTVTYLEESGTMVPLPESERQARPLTALPPEQQVEAWQQAVETAPGG